MGDRAQVEIVGSGVYLYTHWNGNLLPGIVAKAIAREERWSDREYLARIIFEEMVDGDGKSPTGYGISSSEHSDVFKFVRVDCEKSTVVVEGYNTGVDGEYSFQEYVEEVVE
ncbi:MAG: hypothetical protein ABEJ02_02920 [Candidatus Paceibacteria bacterium]